MTILVLPIGSQEQREFLREHHGIYNFVIDDLVYELTVNDHMTRFVVFPHEKPFDEFIVEMTHLPKIIDYLRENLNEEQFKEVEKFCFERI